MKRYKTVYKKVYIQNNVFQFQRNCRNKDRYSPTRRSLIWRPSSTTSPKSEALENAVARSLRFAVPRHQHRVCATHCTGWSREGRRRKGERKAARAGERQTRRGRKDKRDKENEGRERERGQSSSHGVRSTERSIFFLPFSFLPLPFLLFSLYPLLVDTLGARVYVRFLSPPLLRSYLSILLSNLRSLFRPTKHGMDDGGGGWRRRWRWPTTPSFPPCLSILPPLPRSLPLLLEATKGEERRGIAASAKSRLMKSQFNHFTIGRGTIEEEKEGGRLVREGRFIWRGRCRPLLYRHT